MSIQFLGTKCAGVNEDGLRVSWIHRLANREETLTDCQRAPCLHPSPFLKACSDLIKSCFHSLIPSHPMPLAHVCQVPSSCTGQEEHTQVAGSRQGQAHLLVTMLILEGPEGHLCYGFVGKERAALLKVFTFPKSCGERQLRSMANSQ